MLQYVDPFVGRYYSKEWVRKNILQQSEEDIEAIDEQIERERTEALPVDGMQVDQNGNPIPGAPMDGSVSPDGTMLDPNAPPPLPPKKFIIIPDEMELIS